MGCFGPNTGLNKPVMSKRVLSETPGYKNINASGDRQPVLYKRQPGRQRGVHDALHGSDNAQLLCMRSRLSKYRMSIK